MTRSHGNRDPSAGSPPWKLRVHVTPPSTSLSPGNFSQSRLKRTAASGISPKKVALRSKSLNRNRGGHSHSLFLTQGPEGPGLVSGSCPGKLLILQRGSWVHTQHTCTHTKHVVSRQITCFIYLCNCNFSKTFSQAHLL